MAFSLTSSPPIGSTTPALPMGLACDFFGQPLGPMFSSVAGWHVTKPFELIFVPDGR